MPELRRVTLSREQRNLLTQVLVYLPNFHGDQLREVIRRWDAAEPLACPACNGTGLTPSLEGCGTRVQCRACHGTGVAA